MCLLCLCALCVVEDLLWRRLQRERDGEREKFLSVCSDGRGGEMFASDSVISTEYSSSFSAYWSHAITISSWCSSWRHTHTHHIRDASFFSEAVHFFMRGKRLWRRVTNSPLIEMCRLTKKTFLQIRGRKKKRNEMLRNWRIVRHANIHKGKVKIGRKKKYIDIYYIKMWKATKVHLASWRNSAKVSREKKNKKKN